VVGLALAAVGVVVAAGSGGGVEGGERPPVAGIEQPPVPRDARQHDESGPRGTGDRRGSRVAAPGPSIDVAGRVVPELREDPGAEDGAESGKTGDDLGVRVSFKTLGELGLEPHDLVGETVDHHDELSHHLAIGLLEQRRSGQLRSLQRLQDLPGPTI